MPREFSNPLNRIKMMFKRVSYIWRKRTKKRPKMPKKTSTKMSKEQVKNPAGKIILLDAGHGGFLHGEYQTAGKRAYFKNGDLMSEDLSTKYREENCDFKYYEGVGNREIREMISAGLKESGIEFRYINTGEDDMNLSERCYVANAYCEEYGTKNCIFISIHSNGFSKASARGYSFYTSIGQTASDKYAEILYEEAAKMFPNEKARTSKDDGDLDKEANFKVLRSTNCAAVLGECFFHTNPREVQMYFSNTHGKQMIADMYVYAIERMVAK